MSCSAGPTTSSWSARTCRRWPEDRLLHACHHVLLGGFSHFRAIRDVAQLLLVSDVDWEATADTAQRRGVGAVMAVAFRDSWTKLHLDAAHPALDWARRWTLDRRDEAAIEVFRTGRPFREQALTALPVLRRRLVPGYLLALGLPSAEARAARGRSLAARTSSPVPAYSPVAPGMRIPSAVRGSTRPKRC